MVVFDDENEELKEIKKEIREQDIKQLTKEIYIASCGNGRHLNLLSDEELEDLCKEVKAVCRKMAENYYKS